MKEHISSRAPDSLPEIDYARVSKVQAEAILLAMEQQKNQDRFEVTFLPVETQEQREAAATEWAEYRQAAGDRNARERGAIAIMSTRNESSKALLDLLEDKDKTTELGFVTHSLARIIKKAKGASSFELLRKYYGFDESE